MTKENWEDIHKEFGKKTLSGKTYQQKWEENGLTYHDAQEWVRAGLESDDYLEVKEWKSHNFTPQQAKSWMDVGLTKKDAEFIAYLRWRGCDSKDYQSSKSLNWKQIKVNGIPTQEYLDCFYTSEQKNIIKYLDINNKNLTGNLDLSDFGNLEELHCENNSLINLILPQNTNNLKKLILNYNNFHQDLSFLEKAVNLERLELKGNKLYGSLEPLKEMRKLRILNISDTDIDSGLEYLPKSIEYFFCSKKEAPNTKVKAIYDLFANEKGKVGADLYGKIWNLPQKLKSYKQWRNMDFSEEEIKKFIKAGFTLQNWEEKLGEWKKQKFSLVQTKEWVSTGVKANDCDFATWLRDIKNETPEWITNYKEDYQILSERFKKYGLCQECNQPNTGEQWCQDCNSKRFEEDFPNWTSKNQEIDEFIQKYQLEATDKDKFIEWIPYEQFVNVEYLAQGGFGKVYKAKWIAGNINCWDNKNKKWQRNHETVVLKSLNNSSKNTDFLRETEKHKIIDDWFNNIVPCYGLSREPNGNYFMVMRYMPEGDLRNYLSNKNKELSLKDKISQLLHIAQGLKDIHSKNLVHRDFHSGNILKGIEKTSCLITDLGLCKPVNEIKKEDNIFGVMPYVAPEVLRSQPYTKEADIYSFGVIAYEVLSGLPPYYDVEHDLQLALTICKGERPQLQIKIPQLLEDLIKKCWNTNPNQRPTANEIERTLREWEQENTEFQNQLQLAEEHNKTLPDEIKYPDYKKKMHTGAVYTSRLLPTKEITKLLSQSQEASGLVYLKDTSDLDSCIINVEENLASEQQTQIIHNPPK